MNKLEILSKYPALLAAITAAMLAKAGSAKATKGDTGTVSDKLREFARVTHADGVDAGEARKALVIALDGEGLTVGSVKASGNHFAGFRAMLAANVNIDDKGEGKPYTTADAQNFIASDDVKRVKAIRDAIGDVIRVAGKVKDGDSGDDNRETRLKEIAEMIGADLKAYNAMLDTIGNDGEETEQVQNVA